MLDDGATQGFIRYDPQLPSLEAANDQLENWKMQGKCMEPMIVLAFSAPLSLSLSQSCECDELHLLVINHPTLQIVFNSFHMLHTRKPRAQQKKKHEFLVGSSDGHCPTNHPSVVGSPSDGHGCFLDHAFQTTKAYAANPPGSYAVAAGSSVAETVGHRSVSETRSFRVQTRGEFIISCGWIQLSWLISL